MSLDSGGGEGKAPAKCVRCGVALREGEAVSHQGRPCCEDCLMDLMSPAKACDPWAVRHATSSAGDSSGKELVGLEKALYELVRERGRIDKAQVPALLGAKPSEVERAFAVLRHMELLRGAPRQGGGVDYLPFASR